MKNQKNKSLSHKSQKLKLKATQELRLKRAQLLGEYVGKALQSAAYTPRWAQWVVMFHLAVALERAIPLGGDIIEE